MSGAGKEHSKESIIKDAIYSALYPNLEATAADLFDSESSTLPCSREDFDRFLSELAETRRIKKDAANPPVYSLIQY
jgi:hypothetical protein